MKDLDISLHFMRADLSSWKWWMIVSIISGGNFGGLCRRSSFARRSRSTIAFLIRIIDDLIGELDGLGSCVILDPLDTNVASVDPNPSRDE